MRTTLNIEDDALLYARQTATQEGISLSRAVSLLIRRAYNLPVTEHTKLTGKYSLIPRQDGKVITSEHVYRLLNQADIEKYL